MIRVILPNLFLGALGGLLGWALVQAWMEAIDEGEADSVRGAKEYPIPSAEEEVVVYVSRR